MEFLDRKEELHRLNRLCHRRESALAVLWGRRRIGKTRLLLEWVRRNDGLYWVADESSASIQRRYFAEALEVRLPGFGQVEYQDWVSLFSRLGRDAKNQRWHGPLVIDELPYLVGVSPELPSVLQRFIDHDAKDADLVVGLAGSSQRMMQGLVLAAEAPLFGRATELIKLEALPAGYLADALDLTDPIRVIESYALWGGIPRYWELAASYRNALEATDDLVLNPRGPLHDEPTRLLLEQQPPAIALRPVLDAIGAGAHRVSEIAGRLAQPATSLSRPLTRLQEHELVVRELPFGESERSSKRALYKLADPFLRLWFSVVAPHRGLLAQTDRSGRLRLLEQALPKLQAAAWEELCRLAVPRLDKQLGGRHWGPARRHWRGNEPEWDLVARTTDGGAFLLGEAKWSPLESSPSFSERVAQSLIAKGLPSSGPSPGADVHYALFLAVSPRRKPRMPKNHVHIVTAADVLSAHK